ncbi:MAG: hypothetical protein ACYDG2_18730 [Ruminiclostridium sp.]
MLGKLYLLGKDLPKDKELAIKWLTRSAEQGNEYAKFFLDNMDKFREPSLALGISMYNDTIITILVFYLSRHKN